MKNWNLIALWIEKIIRGIALVFGTGVSLLNIFIYVNFFNILNGNINSPKVSEGIDKLSGFLIWVMFPLVISIFIIVATRKFKELNQLIEENKNL